MSTKIDEILRTKKESGMEQFDRLRTDQEKRSARAARTATLSRRSAEAAPDETRRAVRVTAVVRPGHDGFYRAGQFWPSAEGGRVAVVTERMLAALKSEPNLRVEVDPSDADVKLDDQDVLDVPIRESIDLSQVLLGQEQAAAQGMSADAIRAAFQAGVESAGKDAEIARLKAELFAAQGGKAAPSGDDSAKGASKK